MRSDAVPDDCRACARCCFSESPEHVRVFGGDWDRMDERAQAFTIRRDNRCFMNMDGGRCAALLVDVERGTFACGIYEVRPDVCRSLDRGTSICIDERQAKAGRPEAVLIRLRTGADEG